MTQSDLIITYVSEFGEINPAKMAGKVYYGEMFGSESPRRCRQLRNQKKLISKKEGKFTVYYLPPVQQRLV